MFFSHPQRLKFVFPRPTRQLKVSDAPDMRTFKLLLGQKRKSSYRLPAFSFQLSPWKDHQLRPLQEQARS
jgi:hypothetical protein